MRGSAHSENNFRWWMRLHTSASRVGVCRRDNGTSLENTDDKFIAWIELYHGQKMSFWLMKCQRESEKNNYHQNILRWIYWPYRYYWHYNYNYYYLQTVQRNGWCNYGLQNFMNSSIRESRWEMKCGQNYSETSKRAHSLRFIVTEVTVVMRFSDQLPPPLPLQFFFHGVSVE